MTLLEYTVKVGDILEEWVMYDAINNPNDHHSHPGDHVIWFRINGAGEPINLQAALGMAI